MEALSPPDTTLARYFALAFSHLPELMALHDPDGTYRLASPQLRQITGRRPGEVLGRSPYEWMHPDDIPVVRRRYHDAILAGAAVNGRFRLRHEAGHYVWLDFVAIPLFQDPAQPRMVSGIFSTARDVSALVDAQAASRERLHHLTLMQDLAHLVWFTYDFATGALEHNEAFVEMTGMAASAFGSRHDWKRLIHPMDRPVLRRALLGLWRRPAQATATAEIRLVVAHSPPRWVRVSLSFMNTRQGRQAKLYAVVLDIDELVRSREQTQRWVRQRERDGMRARLETSHELHDEVGQVLTGLRWQMEALQANLKSGSTHFPFEQLPLADWIRHIDEAHQTLRAISHRLRPPLAALGLRAAIQRLAEEYRTLWLGQTRLDLTLDERLPDGDEWRVKMLLGIVREALNNVARHARASVVQVRVTGLGDGLLRLIIQDDGVGMHVHEAQSGETLGLVSLTERARMLDGRLFIESRPGEGTRISLNASVYGVQRGH